MFVQRGDFVVSVMAGPSCRQIEAPTPPTLTTFRLVVGWVAPRVRFGGFVCASASWRNLVWCQHEHRKKASFVLPARVILVSARRGVTKAYPRLLRPRRGAARSAQTPHAHDMELVATSEPQTLPRRASCECVRVKTKKKEGPTLTLYFY